MAGRFVLPRQTAFDSSGNPRAYAKLYFYESGTSTPLTTYSDDALTAANTNPVIADQGGTFGSIFLQSADYKVVLATSTDVVVSTDDPVRALDAGEEAVVSVSTSTAAAGDGQNRLFLCDATSSPITITLPTLATAGTGQIRVIKTDSSSNAVTIDGNGSETIQLASTFGLPVQWDAATFDPGASTWYVITKPQTEDSTPLPLGYLSGFAVSLDSGDPSNDISVGAGSARSGDNTTNINLDSAIVKRVDAVWSVGTSNGGMDTGSVTADTTYYGFVIKRTDSGVVDVLISASPSAPTMPASYTKSQLTFMFTTNSSTEVSTLHSLAAPVEYRLERSAASDANVMLADNLDALTYATEIEIHFESVSSDTNSAEPIVRIGPAGGVVFSGYFSSTSTVSSTGITASTDGFHVIRGSSASESYSGLLRLSRSGVDSDDWRANGLFGHDGGGAHYAVVGGVSLSGPLTCVEVPVSLSADYDGGFIWMSFK